MGGRGAKSTNSEILYFENLKRLQQERLKTTPKEATITRDAIKNAIKYADDKIKEIKNRR